MEKYGFIYIWFDRKHKKFYVGSHWGTIDDGYVCSSRWMKQSYKRRPKDFKRRILKNHIYKESLKQEEYMWLKLIKKDELGKKYYNLTNILNGDGWVKGKPRTDETKHKVSLGLKTAYRNGLVVWNKDMKSSLEYRKKISDSTKKAMLELSEDTKLRVKKTQFKKGNKLTTEQKMVISEKSKNSWLSGDRKITLNYLIVIEDQKYITNNLTKFCKEHNLAKNSLYLYLRGIRNKIYNGKVHIERIYNANE